MSNQLTQYNGNLTSIFAKLSKKKTEKTNHQNISYNYGQYKVKKFPAFQFLRRVYTQNGGRILNVGYLSKCHVIPVSRSPNLLIYTSKHKFMLYNAEIDIFEVFEGTFDFKVFCIQDISAFYKNNCTQFLIFGGEMRNECLFAVYNNKTEMITFQKIVISEEQLSKSQYPKIWSVETKSFLFGNESQYVANFGDENIFETIIDLATNNIHIIHAQCGPKLILSDTPKIYFGKQTKDNIEIFGCSSTFIEKWKPFKKHSLQVKQYDYINSMESKNSFHRLLFGPDGGVKYNYLYAYGCWKHFILVFLQSLKINGEILRCQFFPHIIIYDKLSNKWRESKNKFILPSNWMTSEECKIIVNCTSLNIHILGNTYHQHFGNFHQIISLFEVLEDYFLNEILAFWFRDLKLSRRLSCDLQRIVLEYM